MHSNIKSKVAKLLVTIVYVGKTPYAPGTFGSLIAFPVLILPIYYLINNPINYAFIDQDYPHAHLINLLIAMLLLAIILTIMLFLIGLWSINIYLKSTKDDDPKEVVIDELVGQMLTMILSCFSVLFTYHSQLLNNIDTEILNISLLFIVPFILFRFFDIVKPWPINWCDQRIKGAFGIMFDDIVAAIFAAISQYALLFLIDDFASKLNI